MVTLPRTPVKIRAKVAATSNTAAGTDTRVVDAAAITTY